MAIDKRRARSNAPYPTGPNARDTMIWKPKTTSLVIGAILLAPALAILWTIHERVNDPLFQGQTVSQWVRQYSSPSVSVQNAMAARLTSIVVGGTNRIVVGGLNLTSINIFPTSTGLVIVNPIGSPIANPILLGLNPGVLANPNLARMIPALASVPGPPGPGFDQASIQDLPFLIKAANARESVYDRGINFAWTNLQPKLPAAIANRLPTPNTGRRTIRMMAISTLGRLGATDAVPTLTRALKDSEKGIPVAAAAALRMIGPNARPANRTLVGLLKNNDRSIRAAALSALWITGRSDSAVPPALEKVLSGLTSDVRVETADLYWQICRRKDVLVPALIEELREMDPQHFWRATQLLSEMMPESKSAIPTLIKALRHSENRIRGHAAMALAGMGPPAASAIPALTELLQDDTAYVREAAAEALKKIAPGQGLREQTLPP